jgi:hypothetical protein
MIAMPSLIASDIASLTTGCGSHANPVPRRSLATQASTTPT